MGFLRRGLIAATLKDCGTYPDNKERLIISSKEVPIKGTTSLSSLVGMGSKLTDEDRQQKNTPNTQEKVAPVKVSDVGEPAIPVQFSHLVVQNTVPECPQITVILDGGCFPQCCGDNRLTKLCRQLSLSRHYHIPACYIVFYHQLLRQSEHFVKVTI